MSPERTGFHFIPPPAGGGTPCRRAFKKPTEESKKDRRRGAPHKDNNKITVQSIIKVQQSTKVAAP